MEKIIEQLKVACIDISNLIKDGDPDSLGSYTEVTNKTGDSVKLIDHLSNTIMIDALKECPEVRSLVSEEEDDIVVLNETGKYMVCFDPLDGSSNVEVNITTGSIFGVYEYKDGIIENGHNIVLAGYTLYSGSTQLVLCSDICEYYTLVKGKFKFLREIKLPSSGPYYSINESNKHKWIDPRYSKVIEKFIEQKKSARWVGSLVADAHRTLLKGGFFAYPVDTKNMTQSNPTKGGKIRLLYEAYVFAYIFESLGGYSTDGKQSILDIPFPKDIHMKVGITLASPEEYNTFINE
jgi:fructose-1,6-bisphosphatase I